MEGSVCAHVWKSITTKAAMRFGEQRRPFVRDDSGAFVDVLPDCAFQGLAGYIGNDTSADIALPFH